MSVDSGLSGPVEGSTGRPDAPRSTALTRAARPREARREKARADALADAVSSTPRPASRGAARRKGRRVTRVVRRIELWSVLKIALVFNTVMLGIALASVALLWGLANTTGLVDDLENFLRDAGFEDLRFQGEKMFEQVAFIGAVGALAFTVFIVLAVALVNLISEITGGIRFSVIEEIPEERRAVRPPAPLPLPTTPPVVGAVAPPGPSRPVPPGHGPPGPARPSAATRPSSPSVPGPANGRPAATGPPTEGPSPARAPGGGPSTGKAKTPRSGAGRPGRGPLPPSTARPDPDA